MNQEQENSYFFIVNPNYLYLKDQELSSTPATISIIVIKGNHKQDEIVTVAHPTSNIGRQAYEIASSRLEFVQRLKKKRWQLIKLQIHREYELIGLFYLSTKEYIRRFEEDEQNYYHETVKISKNYQLQFQLFISSNLSELNNLYSNYHSLSSIKTPYSVGTKNSQLAADKFIQYQNSYENRIIESRIMMPLSSVHERQKEIEQQQQQEYLVQKMDNSRISSNTQGIFKIALQEVPLKTQIKKQYVTLKDPLKKQQTSLKIDIKQQDKCRELIKTNDFNCTDMIKITFFGFISLIMIYLSMIPIKKI